MARVLIVEDEVLVAIMLEGMLRELGHETVACAHRLEDGLAHAQSTAVDFAMLDMNLREATSLPIAKALTERAVPFIFATGYGREGVPPAYTVVPVLTKPFVLAELEVAIRRLFATNGSNAPQHRPSP